MLLKVGGNLTGNITSPAQNGVGRPVPSDQGQDSANVGNWLWRQGNGLSGSQAQATAWWINFGSYVASDRSDQMVGFTGFGTLGGGNLNVDVGGDAGLISPVSSTALNVSRRSQGLVLAVGSTGRVGADGSVQLTGGGDLNLRVGGAVNPASQTFADHLNGALVNLRGHVQLTGGALGSLTLRYGNRFTDQSPSEVRAYDPLRSTSAMASGGLSLLPGDATFGLSTRGDLVLQDVADPGRAPQMNALTFVNKGVNGIGQSWFSLWTDRTAVDLFSAGGNLTPLTQTLETDMAAVYPATLRAVAANGSLYYGSASTSNPGTVQPLRALVLAPSSNGQLELLAGDSISGGDLTISRSSAAPNSLATILRPAFAGFLTDQKTAIVGSGNLSSDGNIATLTVSPLFAFGPNTASMAWGDALEPARFYALNGDLLGVNSGRALTITGVGDARFGQTFYEGAGPVWMQAGRDIVGSGTRLSGASAGVTDTGQYTFTGNLFVHNSPTDISIASAGRDILYSSFNVAGPGTLELTAGRNIQMEDKVAVNSLGAVAAGDSRPGASIVMQAGMGPNGPDYRRFVEAYLNPANLAQAGESLQGAKVAKTYENELVTWLTERFGFAGDSEQARTYYAALPAEQQRIFARDVYFAELKAAGREYNQDGSVRQGSYVRGRAAIARLFPETDVAGNPITYKGDITMFGGAGVHTNFGGSIQMLTPGGRQTFGIEGAAPPSTAGVITQGAGDIQLYSLGSILLGQSRIMTTFGGSIMAWTSEGDINAGRGSKTTVVYTPPKRVYDNWGNVSLSPSVPSTGAGIATLNPIPEVPAGDIDLIAPMGTIDAGEAGIRVSGNVNIAALRVVNAANIQTQGKSSGVPVSATVNTGAMSSASAAGAAASQAAEDAARSQQAAAKQGRPSIMTVEVLSLGTEPLSREPEPRKTSGYNPDSPVQVLGAGPLSEQARARLTDEERKQISL
ncbi:Filamentous haemagglutinin family outer membrane protein [Pseudomonas marginalis]|nr:Filamentous haemagglutinin family outer membrane protein [Pseudomonas marginalis]